MCPREGIRPRLLFVCESHRATSYKTRQELILEVHLAGFLTRRGCHGVMPLVYSKGRQRALFLEFRLGHRLKLTLHTASPQVDLCEYQLGPTRECRQGLTHEYQQGLTHGFQLRRIRGY